MGYRIAQAAERSGVPASTIRYYEDEGLLPPAQREDNGYRSYDDRDVARLRFLDRARALGLPMHALGELLVLWDDGGCAPVVEELRDRVAARLDETQRRIATLIGLAGDLQQALGRLEAASADQASPAAWCADDPAVCFDDAAPFGDEVAATDGADGSPDGGQAGLATQLPTVEGSPLACTLEPERMPARMAAWQDLVDRAAERKPIQGGVALRFPVDADLAGEITTLAAAERDCCTFLRFGLRITATAVILEVTGPPEAAPMIAAVFGSPGRAGPSPSDAERPCPPARPSRAT